MFEMQLENGRLVTKPVSEWVGAGSLISVVTPEGTKVMIIHKTNPKNYVCYDEQGRGFNVRIAGQKKLPADTPFDRTAYNAAIRRDADRRQDRERKALDAVIDGNLTLGTVVEFTSPRDSAKFPGKYVVLGLPSPKGTVRVAKLGGDNGRYVTGPVTGMHRVEL